MNITSKGQDTTHLQMWYSEKVWQPGMHNPNLILRKHQKRNE